MLKHLAAAMILASFALPAEAAPYDGKWVVDFPPYTVAQKRQGCDEMRVSAIVNDNQITARLERMPDNPREVVNSTEPQAQPLTGTVAPDGSFTAKWENFVITGKLSNEGGVAHVESSCGPRDGTIVRVPAQ